MHDSFLSRHESNIGCLTFITVCVLCMWVAGCFIPNKEPVRIMQKELDQFPGYSIICEDVEDGWFRNYIYLKGTFRTLESANDTLAEEEAKEDGGPEKELENAEPILEEIKRKYQVRDGMVRRYEPYVGMVVASKMKKGGQIEVTGLDRASPPYYHYVGHRRYGYWIGPRWHFYPSYSSRFGYYGGAGVMITRPMYSSYRSSFSTRQPYFGGTTGGRPMYGSSGSVTAKANPGFVSRYQSKTGSSYSRPGASSYQSSSAPRPSTSKSSFGSRSSSSGTSSTRSSGFFSGFSSGSRSSSSRGGFSGFGGK